MDRTKIQVACCLLLVAACDTALGQAYPMKPIRIIAGVSPGGSNDTIARIVGQSVSDSLGQQVQIDNRPGAGGNIAAELAVKSAPDGYTALISNPGLAINAAGRSKLSYDATKDFAPVAQLSISSYLLSVSPSLPVKSVKDLIALAKAKPGAINFASSGTANSDHLTGELLKLMTGINIVHVPYKSAPLAVSEVAGGQVEMTITGLTVSLPLVRAGKLRALAVTTLKRSEVAPEIPTMSESGVPGYEQVLWSGVFAPAQTPRNIITLLNAEFNKALKLQGVRERLSAIGAEAQGGTPEDLGALLKSEIATFRKVMRAINLKLD